MAYGLDVITSPKYGNIRVGEVVQYAVDGVTSGLYPNTTFIPTILLYDDILPALDGKIVTNNIWSDFANLTFNSMSDVVDALNSDTYRPLVTDIEWIWGAPDVGGFGVLKSGTDSYEICFINGYIEENDTFRADCHISHISHPHGIDVTNPPLPPIFEGGLENIPPDGFYQTGIFFVTNGAYNESTNSIDWDEPILRYNPVGIINNCHEGYVIDELTKPVITFTDVASNISTSWMYNFINSMPIITTPLLDPIWKDKKIQQWSFDSFYPNFGNAYFNEPRVEGTSLFGGESTTIDAEGNPYEVGNQPTGGGGGPQSRYSENTLPEGVPALNLLNSGFVKLYNPTLAEVQQFASFLFSDITEDMASVIKRMMVNPIDYILALNMIHIPLTTGNKEEIGFCGISSNVNASVVNEQYYEIEYQLNINEFWNTALDYSSYTKCKIYVPYCGIYDISIDEIMSGTLWLRYAVDVVSGSVVAFVGTKRVQKDGTPLRATLYQYNGNCILAMPVSQTNWQNIFSSVLNIATTAIAPSPSSVAGMAQDIMSQKVSVQKSGSISANFGYLGKQTPYVILERPELSIPVDYGHHEGYPANHKRKLGEVHGYTEIKADTLIANNFTGTKEELEMLKTALEKGVILEQ